MEHIASAARRSGAETSQNGGPERPQYQKLTGSSLRPIGAEGAVAGEYSFENRKVRTLTVEGEVWFVYPDLYKPMCLRTPAKALARLDDDQKGMTIIHTPGGRQSVSVISESGLYSLVMTSRKPQTLAFRRWVTREVLVSIRKNGFYVNNGGTGHPAGVTVLPEPDYPTRYVVLAFPGRPAQIRRTQWQSELVERTQLDCEGLCYAIKSIEVWWQKVQQMQLGGADPTGGFALNRLERAVFEGASIADQYLTYGRPEAS
jgi:BRO family, N-terminal domain